MTALSKKEKLQRILYISKKKLCTFSCNYKIKFNVKNYIGYDLHIAP